LNFLIIVNLSFSADNSSLLQKFIYGFDGGNSLEDGVIVVFEREFDLELGNLGLVHDFYTFFSHEAEFG
jgi:hypothetical protein